MVLRNISDHLQVFIGKGILRSRKLRLNSRAGSPFSQTQLAVMFLTHP
jgi:hypothetical protein